jgi:hypothetical protein
VSAHNDDRHVYPFATKSGQHVQPATPRHLGIHDETPALAGPIVARKEVLGRCKGNCIMPCGAKDSCKASAHRGIVIHNIDIGPNGRCHGREVSRRAEACLLDLGRMVRGDGKRQRLARVREPLPVPDNNAVAEM